MARPTAMDELFVHQLPRAAPERRDPPPALAGELLLRRPRPDRRRATSSSSRWRTTRRGADGLAADGPGRRRAGARLHRPALRRRPAHARRRRGARVEVVRPFEEIRLFADPDASRDRHRPHVPRPHPAVRAAPRHDARRPTRWSGTSATSSSRAPTTGTYTVDGDDARGRRLDRPARPLVGHPRPRALPAVAVVPDPARRRLPRRLALGVRQRRPRLHRRLLGRRPTAATRCRWSTSTTTSTGSAPTAGRVAYGEHGDDGRRPRAARARSRSPTGGAIDGRGRGHASPGPYEPFHRGGLNQMRVRTDDGRAGTAIYEVTGARHHRYFPDTVGRRECCRHDVGR